MKQATILALLLLALCASAASGAGINLSLNDCGTFGGVNAAASCSTNAGVALSLVGSVVPPAGVDRMIAMEGYIDVRTEAGTLSPWWTLDGCRTSALTFAFDFAGGPYSCNDFWAGQASGGGGISPWHATPDRFQIKFVCATVAENAIAPGTEHYLFKVNILRSKSTGAGSCAGCNDAACLVLSRVVLNQPAGVGDYTLTEAVDRNWVTYNANPNLGECPGAAAPPPPPPPTIPAAPALTTPANGALGVESNPLLAWSASAGATSYRLQVSTGVGFWTLLVNEPNLTTTSWAMPSLAANTAYYWRVNASSSGGTSSYSPIWSFTTAPPPPPAPPMLGTPVDGATGVATNPTLLWFASAGATSCRLQVSTDAEFGTLVVNQANITTPYTALGSLAAYTAYYWRVNASNAGGTSAYSPPFSFTTGAAPAQPPAPVLLAPANGATGVATNPTLAWNASAGATSYRLQVSLDAGFGALVVNQANITTPSQAVNSLAASTVYYWRVNASSAGGTSGYSMTFSFTTATPPPPPPPPAPVLATPVDGATGVATNPTLAWNASAGATSYRLQVSTDAGFVALVVNQASITTPSQVVSSLAATTVYYWRVRASNVGGSSEYSTTFSFTTATPPPPPPAPLLATPVDGATGVATGPTLVWNASAGATSYRLQVSTDAGFGALVVNQANLTTPSRTVSSLAASTDYYWRVNASNAGGTSGYSTTFSFTTAAPPPPPLAPVLGTPVDGATGLSTYPTLAWNASVGATSYRLQVSTDPGFGTLVVDQANTTTSSALNSLAGNTVHYWRVNASNAAGTSAYSPAWSFTTGATPTPPVPPVLATPVNGATGLSTNPTLAWNTSAGATAYRLQLSTDPGFVTLVSQANLAATSITVSSLAANTVHYWRVNASNGAGTSAYSTVWSFSTGTPPPPPPPPTGDSYINLALNDCGAAGTIDAPANCASNAGLALSIVGSVLPPANVNRMVAVEAYIDAQTTAPTLSPWWTLDGCRLGALWFSFDFTSGPGTCNDFWAGQAAGGGGISPLHTAPNRFQIKLTGATPTENAISPGVEHYMFKANISRAKSTGENSCAGCGEAACLVLNRLVLNQPAGVWDYVVTTPQLRNFVTYTAGFSGCPGSTPAPNRSWGQVKAMFR